MLLALALLTLNAFAAPFLYRWLGRRSFYLDALVPAGVFFWLLSRAATAPTEVMTERYEWIPQLGVSLALRMDTLSLTLALLVTGIGAFVLAYCAQYFLKSKKGAIGQAMFAGQLTAFAAAMFLLAVADDLMVLFIAWEATTVLSYLMIGFARTRLSARRSALTALIVTTFGGLAMLVGFLMVAYAADTMRLSEIVAQLAAGEIPADGMTTTAAVLIFAGAATKSALIPTHFWLPGAMAAPTPVSAYLHAAAMVKAGVYLFARFAPGFAGLPLWQLLVVLLGIGTMLLGGYRALRQFDLKLILAYGTVSQLGFLTVSVGLGSADLLHAGIALMMGHALFKATLFLVVGVIDQRSGTRDIRELAGLARRAPVLFYVSLVAAASMAGVPLTLGFVAKEGVFDALLHHAETPLGKIALVGAVLGSILTVAYSARFILGAFGDGRFFNVSESRVVQKISLSFIIAPLTLAALTLLFGLFPQPIDVLAHGVAANAQELTGASGKLPHLALWHGVNTALLLSAICLGVGAVLVVFRRQVSRAQDAIGGPLGGPIEGEDSLRLLDAERLYRKGIGLLDDFAIWLTGRTQRGSVGFYVSIILGVAVAAPVTAAFLGGARWPAQWHVADSAGQIVAAIVISLAVIASLSADKRFLTVLLVSVSGYGLAVIFALQGAPDLALTQLLVETVVTVAVVLALRMLPARMEPSARESKHKLIRAGLGIAFGAGMVFVAAHAMNSRTALPISLDFPRLAYDGGGGLNMVNVALVDIRAWDTFGEVAVLAIAATGVASLIFVSGRGDQQLHAGFSSRVESGAVHRGTVSGANRFGEATSNPWLTAGHTLDSGSRSIMLEVVVRIIFHSLIVVAVYLLVAGHNEPGGGFAAGLMAGLALAVRYFAGGRYELYEAMPVSAGTMLGLGLGIISLTAMVPLLFGQTVFEAAILQFTIPVLGAVKFTTSTIFDIGVLLIVVGLVSDVLRSFGSRLDWLAGHQAIESDKGPDNRAQDSQGTEGPAEVRI